jgi:hypothetical protein
MLVLRNIDELFDLIMNFLVETGLQRIMLVFVIWMEIAGLLETGKPQTVHIQD